MHWPGARLAAMRRSLAGRLLSGILLAVGGTAIAFGLLFQWIVLNNSSLMVKDGLVGQGEEILDNLRTGPDGKLQVRMHEPMQTGYDAFYRNLKYRVLDAHGAVLVSSERDGRPLMAFAAADATRFSHSDEGGVALSVATIPATHEGQRIYIQTGRSDRFADLAIEAITPAVFQSAALVTILAVLSLSVVLVWLTRRALRPVRAISIEASRISPDSMERRLPTAGLPEEIAPLVNAFNAALDRVQEGYRSQQRFIANAAHELKTPLAVLRAEIELDGHRGHERYLRDIDLMARIVQQLLQLTEAAERSSYAFRPVDVVQIAREVCDFLAPLAASSRIVLALDGDADCVLAADPGALFGMLRNLVENALRYSPPGGIVTVEVAAGRLQVSDQGPGVAPQEVAFLFERFWRSQARQTDGAGLGLAIVAEVARNHGWNVRYRPNLPAGAVFVVGFNEDGSAP
ncbi:sensor histidine kinase [Pseudoduganella albidiflava]|nr:ATP-binding protein [Pseudoduganella albidiflava]